MEELKITEEMEKELSNGKGVEEEWVIQVWHGNIYQQTLQIILKVEEDIKYAR